MYYEGSELLVAYQAFDSDEKYVYIFKLASSCAMTSTLDLPSLTLKISEANISKGVALQKGFR